MDLRPCWNEDTQECEVKVYVKKQLGWIVLWLFEINKRVDKCKVSLSALGQKGGTQGFEKRQRLAEGIMSEGTCAGRPVRVKSTQNNSMVLFKCHPPGKETFHMFLCSHLQAFSNAPGFCCLVRGSRKLCPGKTLWMSHFPLGKMQAVSSFAQCAALSSFEAYIENLFWSLADSYMAAPDFFKNYPDNTNSQVIGREWNPTGSASHMHMACWWDSKDLQGAFAPWGR